MKILAIIGSPRGMKGNTGRLLEEVLSGLYEDSAEIEIISLSETRLSPCVACDTCHKSGVCPIDDDYEVIKEKLIASDAFILASPNYIFSVTAQMKILFDRSNSLIHCLELEGKYGAVVETSGGGEDKEVIDYMARYIGTLGAWFVGGIGSPMAGIRSFPDEANLYVRARKLGFELAAAVNGKKRFPEQEEFKNSFKARMERLVGYYCDEWTYEAEYWKNKIIRS